MPHGKTWLTAALLGLGCLFLSGASAGGGEKNQQEKKKALVSQFVGKTIELKLKDGKVEHAAELDKDDSKALGRFHYKVFTVQLEKGKIYRIDQRGTADDPKFDPYLFLEDGDGVQLEADDDSGGGLNARIVYKAAKTGPYRIVATTFIAGQTGKFILAIGAPNAQETTSPPPNARTWRTMSANTSPTRMAISPFPSSNSRSCWASRPKSTASLSRAMSTRKPSSISSAPKTATSPPSPPGNWKRPSKAPK
jgi:hypothetical protein